MAQRDRRTGDNPTQIPADLLRTVYNTDRKIFGLPDAGS